MKYMKTELKIHKDIKMFNISREFISSETLSLFKHYILYNNQRSNNKPFEKLYILLDKVDDNTSITIYNQLQDDFQ